MTRYIDADVLLLCLSYQKAAFESVHGGRSGFFAKGVACGLDGAIQSVKNAEAEDVSPVKHGKWMKISPAGIYECSECHQNVMTGDIEAYRFCHHCGARMEAGHDSD